MCSSVLQRVAVCVCHCWGVYFGQASPASKLQYIVWFCKVCRVMQGVFCRVLQCCSSTSMPPGLGLSQRDIIFRMWDTCCVFVGHGSFICVTWLIHKCDMSHTSVSTHTCVCGLCVCMCVCVLCVFWCACLMSPPLWALHVGKFMSHKRKNESCHTFEWVMSHMKMSNITRKNESCHA